MIERQDYHRGVSGQFPIAPVRIVYTQAGMRLAAARLEEARAIMLYWATASSVEEAQFLTAILNTAEITERRGRRADARSNVPRSRPGGESDGRRRIRPARASRR